MRKLAALIVLLALGPPSAAEARTRADEATLQYEKGTKLYRSKKYQAAIQAYERALSLGGEPQTLYDLAQAYRAIGRFDKALMNLRLFARLSPRSPLRFMVTSQIAQLETKVARGMPVPEAPEPPSLPAPPPAPVPPPPTENKTPLEPPDPAPAAVTISPPPARSAGARFAVASTPADAMPPARDTPQVPPPEATAPPAAPSPRTGRTATEIAGTTLVVAGAALVSTAIGLGIWAYEVGNQSSALDSKSRVLGSAAAIVGVTGAVSAAVGGGMLWHAGRHRGTARIGVSPAPGGAHASMSLTF